MISWEKGYLAAISVVMIAACFYAVIGEKNKEQQNPPASAKAQEILNSIAKPAAEDANLIVDNLFECLRKEWAAILKKWEAKQNPTGEELAEMAKEMEAFDARVKKLFEKIDEQQAKFEEALKNLEDEIQKSPLKKKGD